MQFNNYLWSIYKKSEDYKKLCEDLEQFKTIDKYLKCIKSEVDSEGIDSIKKFILTFLFNVVLMQ